MKRDVVWGFYDRSARRHFLRTRWRTAQPAGTGNGIAVARGARDQENERHEPSAEEATRTYLLNKGMNAM